MNTSALLKIPAFPPVAAKLLRVAANESSGISELSDLLRSDPALSAEIIRHANSPVFSFSSEITTLDQAAVLLGVERIRALALAAISRTYVRAMSMVDELRAFWRYSMACALLAEKIARASRVAQDTAYCAALLHDIGRLGLMVAHPTEYPRLLHTAALKLQAGEPLDLLQEERTLFGIDRFEAGEWLARTWNLPAEFRAAAAKYDLAAMEGKMDLVAVVLKACRIANSLGFTMIQNPHAPTYERLRETLPPSIVAALPETGADLREQIEADIAALDAEVGAPERESAMKTVEEIREQLKVADDDLLEPEVVDYSDFVEIAPERKRKSIWPLLLTAAALVAILLVYLTMHGFLKRA